MISVQNYREFNDYELLYLINENDENAYNILYQKYRNFIFNVAKKYSYNTKKFGIDINDLIIEGYMGLEKAIETHHKYDNIKFSRLVKIFVNRNIISYIRGATSSKYNSLNNSLYIEDINCKINKNNDEIDILEKIEDKNTINPVESAELNEFKIELYNKLSPKLTQLEFDVFKLLLKGYGYRDISKLLDKPLKSVRNAMDRIHKKSNQCFKEIQK